jgi:hypothetical protein
MLLAPTIPYSVGDIFGECKMRSTLCHFQYQSCLGCAYNCGGLTSLFNGTTGWTRIVNLSTQQKTPSNGPVAIGIHQMSLSFSENAT